MREKKTGVRVKKEVVDKRNSTRKLNGKWHSDETIKKMKEAWIIRKQNKK